LLFFSERAEASAELVPVAFRWRSLVYSETVIARIESPVSFFGDRVERRISTSLGDFSHFVKARYLVSAPDEE